ncbi:MAG: RAD55 family ATPase [Anaerolineae bacterium]|jgi:circadian clock protein KaiC
MTKRVRTGVAGLDEMLHGGFLEGSAILVEGAAGTGKTTLGLQFLYTGIVEEREPGLLITFEEFPSLLLRDAQAHGWHLHALEEANKLRILFTSPGILLSSLQSPGSPLNDTIMRWGIRRVVLDSVDHLQRISSDPVALREIYATVLNALKREEITALLTREVSGTRLRPQRDKLAYIVDALLMMQYVEVNSAIERALLILKTRGSAHAQGIHRYEIRRGGITVTEKFEGLQGLLTGMPSRAPRR